LGERSNVAGGEGSADGGLVMGWWPFIEQNVILTDAIGDTFGADCGRIDCDSTTYRLSAADTNLARSLSMTRAL
jgi:hypothetical protein